MVDCDGFDLVEGDEVDVLGDESRFDEAEEEAGGEAAGGGAGAGFEEVGEAEDEEVGVVGAEGRV